MVPKASAETLSPLLPRKRISIRCSPGFDSPGSVLPPRATPCHLRRRDPAIGDRSAARFALRDALVHDSGSYSRVTTSTSSFASSGVEARARRRILTERRQRWSLYVEKSDNAAATRARGGLSRMTPAVVIHPATAIASQPRVLD